MAKKTSEIRGTSMVPKLRVAFVSPIGSAAGGERVLMEIARELKHEGNEAKVFCLREGSWTKGIWGDDIQIVAPKKGYRLRYPWTVASTFFWLRKELRKYEPTVVHANHASWWIAKWACRGLNAKTVWHLHDFPDKKDFPTLCGERYPPDATIFTSQRVASAYPVLTKGSFSIIPPITIDAASYAQASRDNKFVEQCGLSDTKFTITVSRWQPHKGLHDLVQSVACLAKEHRDIDSLRFVIVGKPSNSAEESYKSSVTGMAADFGILDRFCFIEDCSDAQLRSLFAAATAMIHPATSEGFGLVLLESMSIGLPVIACDAEGPMEVLVNGKYGATAPRGQPEKLAKIVYKIVSDPRQLQVMSDASRVRASQLSRSSMVAQTISLYHRILV